MQANKKRWWRIPLLIWLVLVAGLPVYYLRPDCDWYYARWGAPEEIVKSCRSADNPLYGDEGVYARIFIVRPSAENLEHFRGDKAVCSSNMYPMDALLKEYELPGPYRMGNWYDSGVVDYVECGNGLLLLRDYSRNKGGLFSSRMAFAELSDLMELHPLHVVFFYLWGFVGILVLSFPPFFAIPFLLFWLIIKRVNRGW